MPTRTHLGTHTGTRTRSHAHTRATHCVLVCACVRVGVCARTQVHGHSVSCKRTHRHRQERHRSPRNSGCRSHRRCRQRWTRAPLVRRIQQHTAMHVREGRRTLGKRRARARARAHTHTHTHHTHAAHHNKSQAQVRPRGRRARANLGRAPSTQARCSLQLSTTQGERLRVGATPRTTAPRHFLRVPKRCFDT